MLLYFQKLLEFILQVDDDEIQELIPSAEDQVDVRYLCYKLKDLDSVTKELQSDSTTLSDAHLLFDAVIQRNRQAQSRVSSHARIVENPVFEVAITKVEHGNEHDLTKE